MTDWLDISGGTASVSTEDLAVAADQLKRLSSELRATAAALARLDAPSTPGIYNTGQAQVDIEQAIRMLEAAAHRASTLDGVLTYAAQGYIITERMLSAGLRELQSLTAQWLGAQLPVLLAGAGLIGSSALGLGIGLLLTGGMDNMLGALFGKKSNVAGSSFMRTFSDVMTREGSAQFVRTISQNLGPFLMGAMRLPVGLPQALREKPYEWGAKFLVAGGRSAGLFDATPIRLAETREQPVTAAPQTYADRLSRMPRDGDGAQVVIEKYSVPGEADRFSVYVGGTVTFNPGSTDEPWDMASNMVNATGGESASAAAVREAMAAAGVDKDSPVQFTGFSQGGGSVARIVASEEYNTQGMLSFGGPTGQVPLPHGIPTVLVEHADDPVPALGGEQDNSDAVLVRRDVFDGTNIDKTLPVPSHQYEYYLKTAHLMDESGSPQLDATRRELDSFTAGAKLESSTAYRFERVLEEED